MDKIDLIMDELPALLCKKCSTSLRVHQNSSGSYDGVCPTCGWVCYNKSEDQTHRHNLDAHRGGEGT